MKLLYILEIAKMLSHIKFGIEMKLAIYFFY